MRVGVPQSGATASPPSHWYDITLGFWAKPHLPSGGKARYRKRSPDQAVPVLPLPRSGTAAYVAINDHNTNSNQVSSALNQSKAEFTLRGRETS